MFEPGPPSCGGSLLERSLADHLRRCSGLTGCTVVDPPAGPWYLDGPPHVVPAGASRPQDDATDPAEDFLAGYLERGVAALDAAQAADRTVRRAEATRVRALADFARARPAWLMDLPAGAEGAASAASRAVRPAALAEVSEWAADEVALRLAVGGRAATRMLETALLLDERAPATLAALEAGELSHAHAVAVAEEVGRIVDPEVRARAEAEVLARLGRKNPSQLRAAARRVVARLDAAAAAERLVSAVRGRGVRLHEGDDGMATLDAVLAGPLGVACYRALEAYAEACAVPGDERTKDQRMADCLVELILGLDAAGRSPVRIDLTLVAGVDTMLGGDQPGELDGRPVPAALVRELAYAFGLLPRPTVQDPSPAAATEPSPEVSSPEVPSPEVPSPEVSSPEVPSPEVPSPEVPSPEAPSPQPAAEVPLPGPAAEPRTPGRLDEAEAAQARAADAAAAGALEAAVEGRWTDGQARDLLDLGALLAVRGLRDTALAQRPHLAVVDRLRGTLLALTDATGLRAGQSLGPPPATDSYHPTAELDRFVRLRDRRCRFPGCRARPRRCDLDHECPWPHGPTAHDNLCCLCEHHHRLSHQAPGWSMWRTRDGGLAWRAPDGSITVTHPPPFGAVDEGTAAPPGPVDDVPPF